MLLRLPSPTAAFLLFVFAATARGADYQWADSFPAGHVDYRVNAAVVFDEDGEGAGPPVLIAAGRMAEAGGLPVDNIARWDGERWSPVGRGIDGRGFQDVYALAVFDPDGEGPGAPVLVAGGRFTTADGARNIAVWNGVEWSALGDGVGGTDASVRALHVWRPDAPGGGTLIVGGRFDTAGPYAAGGLATWDGAHWKPLGTGTTSTISALAAFQGNLWVGGQFDEIGGVAAARLARFDGTQWKPPGSVLPVDGEVLALCTWDDGNGERLAIGGDFTSIGGEVSPGVTSFDGTSFRALGSGFGADDSRVEVLAAFDADGSDVTLWAGGSFQLGELESLARFDGTSWSGVGGFQQFIPGASVRALVPFDASGSAEGERRLWIGGSFDYAEERLTTRNACEWDGESILPLGNGLVWVGKRGFLGGRAVSFDPDGPGPGPRLLYVHGDNYNGLHWAGEVRLETNVAAWNGSEWIEPGFAPNGPNGITRMKVLDLGGGPELFVAGYFTEIGGIVAQGIAKWDGRIWSALGSGINPGAPFFMDLVAWDRDGAGPLSSVLVACGPQLELAGGVPVDHVAQWDGNAWSNLGDRWTRDVSGLEVYDEDGNGPAPPSLFATNVTEQALSCANGALALHRLTEDLQWSRVGSGYGFVVPDLETFDPDGEGPASEHLYLPVEVWCHSGFYGPAESLARWDGVSFLDVGFPNGGAGPLEAIDLDGAGPERPRLFNYSMTGYRDVSAWDGVNWRVVGNVGEVLFGDVSDYAEHDPDGPGPATPLLVVVGELRSVRDEATGDIISSGGIAIYGDLSDPLDATSVPHEHGVPFSPVLTAGRAIPTPSRGGARVEFSVAREGIVRASVYDVRGRRVRHVSAERLPAGRHTIVWDGTTDRGAPTGSGVYFLRLEAHGESVTRRIIRIE